MSIKNRTAIALALFIAAGCAKNTIRRDAAATGPVILPNRMCAAKGKVAVSLGDEGERMVCELQDKIGSHLDRCVCWDEGLAADERDKARRMIQEVMQINPCGGEDGAALCMMGQIGRTAASGPR